MDLTNASVERWIIDPDVYGIHDGPIEVLWLSTQKGVMVYLSVEAVKRFLMVLSPL